MICLFDRECFRPRTDGRERKLSAKSTRQHVGTYDGGIPSSSGTRPSSDNQTRQDKRHKHGSREERIHAFSMFGQFIKFESSTSEITGTITGNAVTGRPRALTTISKPKVRRCAESTPSWETPRIESDHSGSLAIGYSCLTPPDSLQRHLL